jgi:hypothetical protein
MQLRKAMLCPVCMTVKAVSRTEDDLLLECGHRRTTDTLPGSGISFEALAYHDREANRLWPVVDTSRESTSNRPFYNLGD